MRFTKMLFGTFSSLLFVAACTDMGTSSSSLTGAQDAGSVQSGNCTLTQGYWKNHESAWPVSSLELGTVTYTKAELLVILDSPVKGDGLISLAHQLIAAKLNIAAGASGAAIAASITAADALIGNLRVGVDRLAPSAVSDLVGKLDAFNSGDIGPGHCGENGGGGGGSCDSDGGTCGSDGDGGTGSGSGSGSGSDGGCGGTPVCGNGVLETGEACDDGNLTAHDGCDAHCVIEIPICGNGYIEAGEECDDGNLVSGDGCSSTCVCDCPH